MKLELLFKREPFKEIFSASVAKFIYELYDTKTNIKFKDKGGANGSPQKIDLTLAY